MALYSYDGPVQHISIATGKTTGRGADARAVFTDVALVPGAQPVELPEQNGLVVALIDAGLLTLATDPGDTPGQSATKGSK